MLSKHTRITSFGDVATQRKDSRGTALTRFLDTALAVLTGQQPDGTLPIHFRMEYLLCWFLIIASTLCTDK